MEQDRHLMAFQTWSPQGGPSQLFLWMVIQTSLGFFFFLSIEISFIDLTGSSNF